MKRNEFILTLLETLRPELVEVWDEMSYDEQSKVTNEMLAEENITD